MNQIVKPHSLRAQDKIIAGVSDRQFGDMKLGKAISTERIVSNQKKILKELGVEGRGHLARCLQTHSNVVKKVTAADIKRHNRFWQAIRFKNCDGLMTAETDIWLGVLVADCLPIFLWQENLFVAGIHAGWRGVLSKIVEKGIEKVEEEYQPNLKKVHAYIGPSIGPCHFEVKDDVWGSFQKRLSDSDKHNKDKIFIEKKSQGKEKKYINLWQIVVDQLRSKGVLKKNIEMSEICTVCQNDRFFSRRGGDRGQSQLAIIGVKNN